MQVIYALISTTIVSLLSLLGALFLLLNKQTFEKLITHSLALSSGVLLGTAFLDLLPESLHVLPDLAFPLTLLGIIFFFSLEKLITWHHHVEGDHHNEEKAVAYLSLIGDGIHNFGDGAIIGAAFLISTPIGITTALAVIAHEIPHELSDFTILIHGGFSYGKALWYNFLSAVTAILGTIIVLSLAGVFAELHQYLLPFAAGNFIYIASSDLIPELHKKSRLGTSLVQVTLLTLGIMLIAGMKTFLHI